MATLPVIRPTPRLEMRWRYATEEEQASSHIDAKWACEYGIVMPVSRNDCRSNHYDEDSDCEISGVKSEVFYKFSTTMRGGGKAPGRAETPYRDGAHAKWDAATLGGMEIWVESLWGDQTRLPAETHDV